MIDLKWENCVSKLARTFFIGSSSNLLATRTGIKSQMSSSSGRIGLVTLELGGARWLSGRVSDSGARGRGFETYRRRVVSLSKTLYSPKVLVNYPGSGGSIPT